MCMYMYKEQINHQTKRMILCEKTVGYRRMGSKIMAEETGILACPICPVALAVRLQPELMPTRL